MCHTEWMAELAAEAATRRLSLFDGFEIVVAGQGVDVDSARVQSLVAYCALHRTGAVPRAGLAAALWPDSPGPQGRTNLRKVIHQLRNAVPDADLMLDLDGPSVAWRGRSWSLDVADFDAAVSAGRYAVADAVYRGDLVPGCRDEWLDPIRAAYRERHLMGLRALLAEREAAGDGAAALSLAARILARDPVDESTGRWLMTAWDRRGDRGRALRVFHGLATALREELDVSPSVATLATRDALMVVEAADADDRPAPDRIPFVGRAAQRRRLAQAWRRAEAGWTSAVLVRGEPGIGKTRLVAEFVRWLTRQRIPVVMANAYEAERFLPYGPIVEWLGVATMHRRRQRLDPASVADLAWLTSGRDAGSDSAPAQLSEAERRRRLWAAITAAIVDSPDPLVLVLEDAQWADQETLRVLHHVIRAGRDAAVLVVVTLRPDPTDADDAAGELFRGLRRIDRLVTIDLEPLSAQETAQLATAYGRTERGSALRRLWQLTGGNPLFVSEALRSDWLSWPSGTIDDGLAPRVQEVIEEHFRRLGRSARQVLDVAAVIGPEFDGDLVLSVATTDDSVHGLDQLWRHGIIKDLGATGYAFTHELVRLAAYGQVNATVRRLLHERTAAALQDRVEGPDRTPATDAARIAAHLEAAGAARPAADWFAAAAERSQWLGACAEAVWSLERAVALLRTLPQTPDRDTRELALLTAFPAPLASVEGYASPRIADVHDRAVALAERCGQPLAAPMLWSLSFAAMVRDDYALGDGYAAQLIARGTHQGDRTLLVEGSCLRGIAAFWAGDMRSAQSWFERAVSADDHEDRALHIAAFGQDPGVVAVARLALVHALGGDARAARAAVIAARREAEQSGHQLTRAAAHVFCGLAMIEVADDAAVRDDVRQLEQFEVEAGPIKVMTSAYQGLVDVMDGARESGWAKLRVAVEAADPPTAPGLRALTWRVMLAAATHLGDRTLIDETATAMWDRSGPAAQPWRHVVARWTRHG